LGNCWLTPSIGLANPRPKGGLPFAHPLSTYQAPSGNFEIGKERKWELASAFQKAIRRADKATSLRLISGIANMPDEYAYFLRRMCVIACEDVGPADDTLVKFLIASAIVFYRKQAPENHNLLCFLAEQMCELPVRNRIYCSAEVITAAADKG
jgi:replication-associated recombination protein RarA